MILNIREQQLFEIVKQNSTIHSEINLCFKDSIILIKRKGNKKKMFSEQQWCKRALTEQNEVFECKTIIKLSLETRGDIIFANNQQFLRVKIW